MALRRRLPLPASVGIVLFIVGVLWVAGGLALIQRGIRSALLPVARVFASVGIRIEGQTSAGQSVLSLQDRVAELEAKLSSVSVDFVKLTALEEENRSLKKISGFLTENRFDHVSAQVISRNVDSHHAEIVIDRGTLDGLENGMAVVAEDGILVGKIISVREHISTVMLTTDEQSRIAASVAGSEHLSGMVQGEGNGVAKMTLIPQSEKIEANTIIVTAGTEDKIPANLPIGLVDHVDTTPTDPFKTAALESLVRLHRLDLLVVLRPAALRPAN